MRLTINVMLDIIGCSEYARMELEWNKAWKEDRCFEMENVSSEDPVCYRYYAPCTENFVRSFRVFADLQSSYDLSVELLDRVAATRAMLRRRTSVYKTF
jgi:hypothetical protein